VLKLTYEIANDFENFAAGILLDPVTNERGGTGGKETRWRVGRVGEDAWAEDRRERSVKGRRVR
jgi:hypothetical protein